jgi:predicted nucleic acid-binding Zn ribbon protein
MLCCPRCGGTDIYEEMGGYTGTIYRCKKCGYRGAFILEIRDDWVPEHEREGDRERSR